MQVYGSMQSETIKAKLITAHAGPGDTGHSYINAIIDQLLIIIHHQ